MRLNWNIVRAICYLAPLALVAGCGGIHASRSISPATFLLPGLLQADPPAPQTEPVQPATAPVDAAVQS